MAFDCRAAPSGEYEPTLPAKIMISRKTLATRHTWNQANYKTPIDRGLDESYFCKLFLLQGVRMARARDSRAPPPDPVTVEEARDYDYNNENDASYCPVGLHEGDEWGNEDGIEPGGLHEQAKEAEPFDIGEMLEPPAKVAKIFIPYAMRAKKIDMKLLKHTAWKLLTAGSNPDKPKVAKTTFQALYSKLESKLPSSMRECLSVSLALLSILHLANEKGLILENHSDMKDFGILGLIDQED